MEKMFRLSEAAHIPGVHPATLQRWDVAGLIRVVRTPMGKRRIPENEVQRLRGEPIQVRTSGVAVYARVSSHEQKAKGDLERQVSRLTAGLAGLKLPEAKHVVTDVSSGMSDKRRGLLKLMKLAREGGISDVVVENKDRLTRFGWGYLAVYFGSHGVKLHVADDQEHEKSVQQELVEDLLAVVTSFSGRLYGLRGRSKARALVEAVKQVVGDGSDI